ncbi:hypothetical protein JEODO184_01294 [Jeotgalicoccus meleagridis]|uniref:Uncharacterized protein n=1 Tax=Jeotgalicoccus meleagridis TaxID=2759181 RepID=A0A6V7RJV5_9STAP|nr:hypothetical protein JEODO184_01294 [Jeotgalicoccus meleagridis]
MKHSYLKSEGFFSLSTYIVLIYLLGLYYYYYERLQLILEIRINLIEIYINQISQIIS